MKNFEEWLMELPTQTLTDELKETIIEMKESFENSDKCTRDECLCDTRNDRVPNCIYFKLNSND